MGSTTRTLHPADEAGKTMYGGARPFCAASVVVDFDYGSTGFPKIGSGCEHLVRAWIVGADQRRRAEYDSAGGRGWAARRAELASPSTSA